MLYGRDDETAAIDRLVQQARAGRSGTLVVRGEAGIGKSALLGHAAAAAGDLRVLRGTGIESEQGMPYAGLHLLLGRHLDRVDGLPEGQARALRGALGMGRAEEPEPPPDAPAGPLPVAVRGSGGDRFMVGLAVLTLLSDLAEEHPLICLIDDAHWLDGASAEALLFAARRLEAEPIVMLFAVRELEAPELPAPGLPELRLAGLDERAASGLLAQHAADLPRHVRHEILGAAMGNPLALLELPSARPEERGGRGDARPATSTYDRIRETFADRVARLPAATAAMLLVAAAADRGDLGVIVAAAGRLGATVADLEPAERARLVRSAEGRLEFRHPLIRTAVYEGAPLARRLAVHAALAGAHGDRGDGCQRAWHLAHAAAGPDENAAAALEGAAENERATGGRLSVAAMYEGAADLSPRPSDRGRRLSVAARAAADAGMPAKAVELAGRAEPDVHDPAARAELVLIQAALADEQDRAGEAQRLLAGMAGVTAEADPATAGYLYFQAASSAANAGDFAGLERIAAEAEAAGPPNAQYVRALARVFAGQNPLGDTADGVDALRMLLEGMGACVSPRDVVRFGMWHLMIGDVAGAHEVAASLEPRFRDQGAIGLLSPTLMLLARTQLMLGRPRDALTSATEGMRIAEDTGQHRIRIYLATILALHAAMRGDEERTAELTREALARDVPPSNMHAAAALGLLDLGLGRHEAALHRLSEAVTGPHRQGSIASLPDLVEAAVRAGRPDAGRDAAAWYADWAAQIRQPWAEAVALRCAALLGTGEQPGDDYARAVKAHREGGMPFERARTELLYGEWLRRSRRRNDARAMLHAALNTFERLGAAPWAERARTELRAAGESFADTAAPQAGADLLTPQELQVVRLAATGLSNREIGAQLFLSPRTVGYHLYKAYPKLGVASRGELARLELVAS